MTGVSANPRKAGQPFRPKSDIDFFVESGQLTEGLPTSRTIPGMVPPREVMKVYPELKTWADKWSGELGRKVSPAGFLPGTVPEQPAIVAPKGR